MIVDDRESGPKALICADLRCKWYMSYIDDYVDLKDIAKTYYQDIVRYTACGGDEGNPDAIGELIEDRDAIRVFLERKYQERKSINEAKRKRFLSDDTDASSLSKKQRYETTTPQGVNDDDGVKYWQNVNDKINQTQMGHFAGQQKLDDARERKRNKARARYQTDASYRERIKTKAVEQQKARYQTDPSYRERRLQQQRERYRKKKNGA